MLYRDMPPGRLTNAEAELLRRFGIDLSMGVGGGSLKQRWLSRGSSMARSVIRRQEERALREKRCRADAS
jgi:hypothetical protein